jgi:Na+-translocating ferredoxin:NAD+ oxidoreductase RnfC subunit
MSDPNGILDRIRAAGVIGAGGAGFPTYRKLGARVEHIIANGAECEPLLYKDRESMIQEAEALVEGLRIMREITGATHVTVAVKKKNEDVLGKLRDLAAPHGFDFLVYPDVYPAGDEYVLVYEITKRLIPPGGIPLDVGCVVDNVETIINVAHAVANQPVTEKYVTVTGEVKNPITTRVPVGTPFRDCIDLAGGLTVDNPVVLTGGVMMGGWSADLSSPIGKSLGGLIVLPADHFLVRRKTASRETYTRVGHGQCDQCSLCTEMCPRYIMGYPIEPHRVMRTLLMTGEARARNSMWAQYCCECNVCSYIACPESLDPKNICVDAKALLRKEGIGRTPAELEVLLRGEHPARKGREIPISTLYTRLGLRPYDRKAPFTLSEAAPTSVTIPLASHVGCPCEPTVETGSKVSRGDVVGSVPDDQLGCPVHASVDGKVTAIGEKGIQISP